MAWFDSFYKQLVILTPHERNKSVSCSTATALPLPQCLPFVIGWPSLDTWIALIGVVGRDLCIPFDPTHCQVQPLLTKVSAIFGTWNPYKLCVTLCYRFFWGLLVATTHGTVDVGGQVKHFQSGYTWNVACMTVATTWLQPQMDCSGHIVAQWGVEITTRAQRVKGISNALKTLLFQYVQA